MSGAPALCPRCGTPLRERQRWCLRCGFAARTALAPAPPWRAAAAGVLVLALAALAAIGYAVAALVS